MKRSSVTFSAFGVAAATAMLLPLSVRADRGSALACSGTWVAHGDSERPLFALKRDVAFEMQVRQCGEAVMLHRIDNGEEVVLERTSRAPNTYVWTQAYAGRTIGWRLTQRAPNAKGQARVILRVSHDGSLLPKPETYSIDHTRCVVDEREYEPTGSFLYFTVFEQLDADPDGQPLSKRRVTRYADGTQASTRQPLDIFYDAQLKQVDLETREIIRAQYASSSDPGDMQESIVAVVEAMQLGPIRLDDGFSD